MDKKYLLKIVILNTAWVIWICLSVFFGYLIADKCFTERKILIIPFSLVFLLVGAAAAFVVRFILKRRALAKTSDVADRDGKLQDSQNSGNFCDIKENSCDKEFSDSGKD